MTKNKEIFFDVSEQTKKRHNIIFILLRNTYINSIKTIKMKPPNLGYKMNFSFLNALSRAGYLSKINWKSTIMRPLLMISIPTRQFWKFHQMRGNFDENSNERVKINFILTMKEKSDYKPKLRVFLTRFP